MKDFNDKWFLLLGIPLVGLAMPMIFYGLSIQTIFRSAYINLMLSLFTTIAIWLGVRSIVVYLWKRYPWEQYPLKHLFYEIGLVFTYTMVIGYFTYLIYEYVKFDNFFPDESMIVSASVTLLITFFITSLHEAWFFYNQWNISLLKAQMLEKENIISQYETLKTQINPHFLFNTLNTLSVIIEENPEKAVRYVGKTADFLRSILSMKDREVISLAEELEIISVFYHLLQERFGDNLTIEQSVSESDLRKMIPPLSLQMLVENAIKHNVISSEKPLLVKITGHSGGYITVSNNLQRKIQIAASSRIGLDNIRKRLSFLSEQAVQILEDENNFTVTLPLLKS